MDSCWRVLLDIMQESKHFRPDIDIVAKEFRLDPDLVEAIVRAESAGLAHAYRYEPGFWTRYLADDPYYKDKNPRRVSASYGLMQLMLPVARERGFNEEPEMLFVPGVNLYWGCRHLEYLRTRVGAEHVVAAYNGGPGGARLPYRPEIARYLQRVQTFLDAIKRGE